jgi:Domain of Unknown Function (DUF1206)
MAGGLLKMRRQELSADQVKHQAKEAAHEASPWIERLGRLGYIAKGVVYILVGVLAAEAAVGAGGKTTDTRGALQEILQAPFGKFLLLAITVGLVGYALWRFAQAGLDADRKGSDAKGLSIRTSYAMIGAIYAGLALTALRLALGSGDRSSTDAKTQSWTAWLLGKPLGPWLVGLAGLVVIGVGINQFVQAYTAQFRQNLKTGTLGYERAKWVTHVGRLGFTARGVVFGIVGVFLIVAAIRVQPGEARGLGGALETLAQQPFGPWLLGLVSLGLIAYGLFMLILALYRHMIVT